MTAIVRNLVIEQGTTFAFGMTLEELDPLDENIVLGPMDLTGYDGAMQIRTAQGGTVIWEGTTAGGGVAIGRVAFDDDPLNDDPTNGRVLVIITDEESDAWTVGKGKYDLEIKNDGPPKVVVRLCKGSVKVDPNITQNVTGDPDGANDAVIA